jgi:hypothetical protein
MTLSEQQQVELDALYAKIKDQYRMELIGESHPIYLVLALIKILKGPGL